MSLKRKADSGRKLCVNPHRQLRQTGNIKVSAVARDLFGERRKMLNAIVEGKHDVGCMADYAHGTLRGNRRALESTRMCIQRDNFRICRESDQNNQNRHAAPVCEKPTEPSR